MRGRVLTYRDSLNRLHLVRIDTEPNLVGECKTTIIDSLDIRAVGSAPWVIASELSDRSDFDALRLGEQRGTTALRQAAEIARHAKARLSEEPREWR